VRQLLLLQVVVRGKPHESGETSTGTQQCRSRVLPRGRPVGPCGGGRARIFGCTTAPLPSHSRETMKRSHLCLYSPGSGRRGTRAKKIRARSPEARCAQNCRRRARLPSLPEGKAQTNAALDACRGRTCLAQSALPTPTPCTDFDARPAHAEAFAVFPRPEPATSLVRPF
jgi:hypothetical protein